MNRYWIVIALALTLAACSGDDGDKADNGTANATANAEPNNENQNPNNIDNTGKEYAPGYQVLFDSLAFNDAPANASASPFADALSDTTLPCSTLLSRKRAKRKCQA